MVQKLSSISEIVDLYDYYLIDLWGVVHDGTALYPNVMKVMKLLRDKHKQIVFISNAPRRKLQPIALLGRFNIDKSFYLDVMTSGEVFAIEHGQEHKNFLFIGAEKDRGFLNNTNLKLVDKASEADLIVINDYIDPQIAISKLSNSTSPIYCINPDIKVVKQTGEVILCAGQLAIDLETAGFSITYYGKPYSKIYLHAIKIFGSDFQPKRTLCIGDSLSTDIQGANRLDLDSLFIAHGIHKEDSIELNEISATYVLNTLS